MSSVNTFMTSALVWLVIVVLVAGLVMGLAFAGTDLLNLPTAKAEAGDIERASRHQEQVDEINLKYYEQERQAQADERKEQYHQETEFQGLEQEQKLIHQHEQQAVALFWLHVRQGVLLGVGSLVLLSVGGGLTFYLISLGRKTQRLQRDLWQSPEWRESMRCLAQANERLLRHLESSRRSPGKESASGGNGRHREPVWSGS